MRVSAPQPHVSIPNSARGAPLREMHTLAALAPTHLFPPEHISSADSGSWPTGKQPKRGASDSSCVYDGDGALSTPASPGVPLLVASQSPPGAIGKPASTGSTKKRMLFIPKKRFLSEGGSSSHCGDEAAAPKPRYLPSRGVVSRSVRSATAKRLRGVSSFDVKDSSAKGVWGVWGLHSPFAGNWSNTHGSQDASVSAALSRVRNGSHSTSADYRVTPYDEWANTLLTLRSKVLTLLLQPLLAVGSSLEGLWLV